MLHGVSTCAGLTHILLFTVYAFSPHLYPTYHFRPACHRLSTRLSLGTPVHFVELDTSESAKAYHGVGECNMADLGDNIEVTVKGNIATFTIDLSKRLGASASGKSETVASTRGNVTIPGTAVKLGLNAYVPAK